VSVIIFLLILAFIAWNAFMQIMARQQTSITCSYDPAAARRIVSKSFGIWWTAVPGRGDDNYKSKRGSRAPTISIKYDLSQNGGCDVDVWCSAWVKNYGVMNHAQLMWRKKRAVVRALAKAQLDHSQAVTQASSGKTAPLDSRRPHTPAQPTIDTINHFDLKGTDQIPTQTPAAKARQDQSNDQPRGKHSRPAP
jgi:hypothetical protein